MTRTNGEDPTVPVDPDMDRFRRQYDRRIEPPSVAVVALVAEVTDRDPTQLEPLDDVLDPDALDALFAPTSSGRFRGDGKVEFTYHDHEVTVYSYGVVEVEAP